MMIPRLQIKEPYRFRYNNIPQKAYRDLSGRFVKAFINSWHV